MPDRLPNVPEHLLQVPMPARRWVQLADAWLVEDWRYAWRFLVVIGAGLLALLNYAVKHSADLALVLPPQVMQQVNTWAPLALMVVRVYRQNIPPRDVAPAPAAPVPKESP
jgi:hypothetical protein